MQPRRPSFELKISFDLILISETVPRNIRVGLVEESLIFGRPDHLPDEVDMRFKKLAEMDKDAMFIDDKKNMSEHMFTSFDLPENSFLQFRFKEAPVTDQTYLVFERERGRGFHWVHMWSLLNSKIAKTNMGIEVTGVKADMLPTNQEILVLVVGQHRMSTIFNPPKPFEELVVLSPAEKREKIDSLVASPYARAQIVREMVRLTAGSKSIPSILRSVMITSNKYLIFKREDLTEEVADLQSRLWDTLLCSSLRVLLLNEDLPDPDREEPVTAEIKVQLQNGSLAIHPFSIGEIADFLRLDISLLRMLIRPNNFLHSLLLTRLNILTDLEVIISSANRDQKLDTLKKIGAWATFDKEVVCASSRIATNFMVRLLTEYITTENSGKKIQGLIEFMSREFKRKRDLYLETITTIDSDREDLFNACINVMVKITRSSIQSMTVTIAKESIVEGCLYMIPGLPSQFFRLAFLRRSLQIIPLMKYFLELDIVAKPEKIQLFTQTLIAGNPASIGIEVCTMVGEMIKNSKYFRPAKDHHFKTSDVFDEIDSKFKKGSSESEILEQIVGKSLLTEFHSTCIITYDQKHLLGGEIEPYLKTSALDKYYRVLRMYMQSVAKKSKMGYLLKSKCFSSKVINLFESLNEEDYAPFHLKILKLKNEAIRAAQTIKRAINFLEFSEDHLKKYSFRTKSLSIWIKFQEELEDLNLTDAVSRPEFLQAAILERSHFEPLRVLIDTYPQFMQAVDQICSTEASLEQFSEAVRLTANKLSTTFASLADSKKFSVALYDLYFPNYPKDQELYEKVMTAFVLKSEQKNKVFQGCQVIYGFKKIYTLTVPLEHLCVTTLAGIKTSNTLRKMSEFKNSIKSSTDVQSLTVYNIEKLDTNGLIKSPQKQDPFVMSLPSIIQHIDKAPELMSFIKVNGDKFIKSMREEVDNDNLDIVTKLDVVNKNLKFLFFEPDIESAVKHLSKIKEEELTKIGNNIASLEGLVRTHLTFLANKTKKDAGYSNQLLKQLLGGCVYVFGFEKDFNEYGVMANFVQENLSIPVSTIELAELLNKTLIIVSDKNSSSSKPKMIEQGQPPKAGASPSSAPAGENQDEYTARILSFSDVGKCLLHIKKLLKKMRDLGIIYKGFSNISPFIEGVKIEDRGLPQLKIAYTKEAGLTNLKAAIDSLTSIANNFEKLLRSCYRPEAYLMSHYYGKKLYWLMEYLTGDSISEVVVQQNLNIMREAHPQEGFASFDFKNYVRTSRGAGSLPLPEEKLKQVHATMQEWTKEVVTKREQPARANDSFFVAMKVMVANNCFGIFGKILRVLKITSCFNVVLSQFLFCTQNTTAMQVLAFTRKALMDKSAKPYFIIHLNKTGYTGMSEFRKVIESLSDEEWLESNPRILVFNEPDSTIKNLLDCELFIDANPSLQAISTSVTDDDVRKLFVWGISKTQVVVSDVSGMGKTTYIQEQAGSVPTVDIFLAGEVTPQTLMKRLHTLSKSMSKLSAEFVLVIKLDFIEDFHLNFDMIDFLLFSLCLINKFKTEYGCFMFADKIKQIYIEVGNTFAHELLNSLSLLQFFSSSGSSLHRVEQFSLQNLKVNLDPGCKEIVAYSFMCTLDFGHNADAHGGLKKDKYLKALQKYLLDRLEEKGELLHLTYARYQYWLKVISHIWGGLTPFLKAHSNNSNLIKQLTQEILEFASGVIGLSVKQVKTSQDEMKRIMKAIDKEKVRAESLAQYQETVKGLMQTWSTKEMIVPLVLEGRELFALANLEMFDEGMKRHGKRNELKKLILSKGWYVNPAELKTSMTDEFLAIFSQVTNRPLETIKAQSETFRNTGFSLTSENFMKICLILLKSALNIPIIMMGESGCGKTYLSHYVAECLLGEKMLDLTLFAGVTEENFLEFIRQVVTSANEAAPARVWVLFDEFNTSCLQSIVAEIMIDRVCSIDESIYAIPNNVVFVACCNPYRMKTKNTGVGLISRSSNVVLSHRVYPIPERLIDYVWDFGQLTETDEISILKGIIKAEKIFEANAKQSEDNYVATIYDSHKFVRDLEERSGVSLRDIKRVLVMYKWFLKLLGKISTILTHASDLKEDQRARCWALVSALMVCYGLRLNGREEQVRFLEDLTYRVNATFSLKKHRRLDVHDILSKISDFFLAELRREGTSILGEGTAINRPLKENFITMLASFDTVTPMIICGAPGTSKTLSTHILNSALVPYVMKKYSLFNLFSRGINPIYYGGSETSTAEGISHVFRRGEKYIEQEGEDRPVVIFDEIGLAELSPYNPLKVLHPLLEKKDMQVGFIGLSNWTLDLSKMNRLIFISRPDMELNDLVEIFESSLAAGEDKILNASLKKYLFILAKAYLSFRDWQKKYGTHPNFHGSRDIYSVAKYFYTTLQSLKNTMLPNSVNSLSSLSSQEQSVALIKMGIERNFSGSIYDFYAGEFLQSSLAAPLSTIEGLDQELSFAVEQSQDVVKAQKLEDIYSTKKQAKQTNDGISLGRTSSSIHLTSFTSSQIFKKFFLNKFASDPEYSSFRPAFMKNEPIFKLISSSTLDSSSRFMLVQSEGEIVENILIENIRNILRDEKIVDWRGVSKKESNLELFSNIKSYISLGHFIIMKNLDELYGSLYDLFNQKFTEVDGRKYCYLYFGESKHRVEVHPKFNCIILVNAETGKSAAEIEVSQPAPFLNRFEKYYLKVSDVFPGNNLRN